MATTMHDKEGPVIGALHEVRARLEPRWSRRNDAGPEARR